MTSFNHNYLFKDPIITIVMRYRQILFDSTYKRHLDFPGGWVVKNVPANAGDSGLTPGSRRSPGEGNGDSLQYSCLGNPTARGAWWPIVHGVAKESETT